MTAYTSRLIRCDAEPDGSGAPPCMSPSPVYPLIPLTVLRKILYRRYGWHFRTGRDICPACWIEGHR